MSCQCELIRLYDTEFSVLFTTLFFKLSLSVSCAEHLANREVKGLIDDVKVKLSKIKHQLDATLCRFYFCRITLTCFGRQAPIIRSIKKTGTAEPGTGVIVAGRSSHHHIRSFVPNMVM